jgi:hypothetical protein
LANANDRRRDLAHGSLVKTGASYAQPDEAKRNQRMFGARGAEGVVMLAAADALPLVVERAAEPQWRQAVARSAQDRCDVAEFDKCEIGRDAYPPINTGVGIGPVLVAGAWLAFYVITAVHALASGS